MSNFKRQAIVSIAAIAGAQIPALLFALTQPGQSSSCLQWASESLDAARQNLQYAVSPPPVSQGYYDVRLKRNVEIYSTPATGTTVDQAVAPNAPTTGDEAATGQSGTISGVLPAGMTEADYQAARQGTYDTSMVLGGN